MKRLIEEVGFYAFVAGGALLWLDVFTKGEVGLVKAIGSLPKDLSVLVWIPVGFSASLWMVILPRLVQDLLERASGNRGKKNQ